MSREQSTAYLRRAGRNDMGAENNREGSGLQPGRGKARGIVKKDRKLRETRATSEI